MTRYDDIIRLPHYEPKHHPRMPMASRAAQFAPFAALTGHDAAIAETARLTDGDLALGDSETVDLNRKMQILAEHLGETVPLPIAVTYFQPDEKKSGGSYRHYAGTLRRIDDYESALVFADGTHIPLQTIADLTSPLFDD